MKKITCLLLTFVLLLSVCSCNNSTKQNETTVPEATVTEATEQELKEAAVFIKAAETLAANIASIQINGWSTNSQIMQYYFSDLDYTNASLSSVHKEHIRKIQTFRSDARKAMQEAKKMMGESGTSEQYQAVKKYYQEVNILLNFVSEFPSGYSKITFSQSVSQYKSNCTTAYLSIES